MKTFLCLLWDLTLTGVNKDEKLFQYYYEILTLIGVDMSNESSWKPLDVYYEIWHSQGWRGLKIPFKPIVGSDISRHSQGWIGKEEIKFMITAWDLFYKKTSQSTQGSGLNHMRGHGLIICKLGLKSVEELRLKHFEWMTNVSINFQDIRKSQRYRKFHKSKT